MGWRFWRGQQSSIGGGGYLWAMQGCRAGAGTGPVQNRPGQSGPAACAGRGDVAEERVWWICRRAAVDTAAPLLPLRRRGSASCPRGSCGWWSGLGSTSARSSPAWRCSSPSWTGGPPSPPPPAAPRGGCAGGRRPNPGLGLHGSPGNATGGGWETHHPSPEIIQNLLYVSPSLRPQKCAFLSQVPNNTNFEIPLEALGNFPELSWRFVPVSPTHEKRGTDPPPSPPE